MEAVKKVQGFSRECFLRGFACWNHCRFILPKTFTDQLNHSPYSEHMGSFQTRFGPNFKIQFAVSLNETKGRISLNYWTIKPLHSTDGLYSDQIIVQLNYRLLIMSNNWKIKVLYWHYEATLTSHSTNCSLEWRFFMEKLTKNGSLMA